MSAIDPTVSDELPRGGNDLWQHAARVFCRLLCFIVGLSWLIGLDQSQAQDATAEAPWPPIVASENGRSKVFRVTGPRLLEIPTSVAEARLKPNATPFEMAREAPVVEIAFHDQLGPQAATRRLWSSWGDICVASDRSVYCGIGDHGNDVGGDARCFVYRWDEERHGLEQVVDMNQVVPRREGQPAWSKVHAKIDEGPDRKIYFSCTLNDGNRAKLPTYQWNADLPGGQLYQFDPVTRRTTVFASLPERRCTATSLVDAQRGIWWCNLEAGTGNALFALDLRTKQVVYQGTDGSVGFNRHFALGRDGTIYFNGESSLEKWDPAMKSLVKLKSAFVKSQGMRCATRETQAGHIYGITHQTNELFRYSPRTDELKVLGSNWLTGSYTAVCDLSPDERFVYFLPGSHGGAFKDGTPVVRFDTVNERLEVLAFLSAAVEDATGYVPAGTYGMKISGDGRTLFVNFNGHPTDRLRPKTMKPIGFGWTAFAAIRLP